MTDVVGAKRKGAALAEEDLNIIARLIGRDHDDIGRQVAGLPQISFDYIQELARAYRAGVEIDQKRLLIKSFFDEEF